MRSLPSPGILGKTALAAALWLGCSAPGFSETAEEVRRHELFKAPLVEVLASGATKAITTEEFYRRHNPVGFYAFRKLSIIEKEPGRWEVSGTISSTNTSTPIQGAAVYVKFSDGHYRLIALSNFKGEVLFAIPNHGAIEEGHPKPTVLWIGDNWASFSKLIPGTFWREYAFAVTPLPAEEPPPKAKP